MSTVTQTATLMVDDDGVQYETMLPARFQKRQRYAPRNEGHVTAVIPGVIRHVFAEQGRPVARGQPLLVLEAMKMENTVVAPRDGMVKNLHVQTGDMVPKGKLLVEIE